MTTAYQWPQSNWLLRETPLGIPIFTPFQIRPWTENCLFAIDAQCVRMVYIGGLSTNDPTVWSWMLYAPATPLRRDVTRRRPWLTSQEPFAIALSSRGDRLEETDDIAPVGDSYHERLVLIETISGLSRRQLATWLQTSHTTVNAIIGGERSPRASLAMRISALSQAILRLGSLRDLGRSTVRRALKTPSLDNKTALDYLIIGDYESAIAAAQLTRDIAKKSEVTGESRDNATMPRDDGTRHRGKTS